MLGDRILNISDREIRLFNWLRLLRHEGILSSYFIKIRQRFSISRLLFCGAVALIFAIDDSLVVGRVALLNSHLIIYIKSFTRKS